MMIENKSQEDGLSAAETPSLVHVSVVVPVFNEEENIDILCNEIVGAMTKTDLVFEVIFVDDGSTDGSIQRLEALTVANPVRYIKHEGNHGQSAALATGFSYAKGLLMATVDGDGQNDPSDIPRLVEHLKRTGAACVTGVRKKRKDTWVRRMSSRIANGFRNMITGDRISDSGCGIRVFEKRCLREIPVFNGMHRFLPTLLRAQGFDVQEIEVNHRPRIKGLSKYGVNNRLWRGLRDCFAIRWYISRAIPADRVKTSEDKW